MRRNFFTKRKKPHRSFYNTSLHDLVVAAICIVVLSGLALIFFYHFFNDAIVQSANYLADECLITNLEVTTTNFDCWDYSGAVTVVNLPCVKIHALTSNNINVIFYRSVQEKMFAIKTNCSYIPSACNNDENFLAKYVHDHLYEYFPPNNFKFGCFVNNQSADSLFNLPQTNAYYLSLCVISFGFFTSFIMILYAIVISYCYSNKNTLYMRFLNDFNKSRNDEEFYSAIKRVLEQAHIDVENLREKSHDEISTHDADLQRKVSNSSSHSVPSALSKRRISGDHIIPLASKLRIGQSEIHIGRIQYNYPKPNSSNAKLSRYNSIKSINSTFSIDNTENPANFYLGDHYDSDLEIPEDIPEEDLEYLTVQKSLKSVKIHAKQIFDQDILNNENKED